MEASVWEKLHNDFEKMSFSEKLNFFKATSVFTNNTFCGLMEYDGCVCRDVSKCVLMGDGDYYVYAWKHNFGDLFYIGSGKGDRWKTINPRCDEFYAHLDKADAVVFKVIAGLDEKTARRCERYISTNVASAGYALANHDFNKGALFDDLDEEVKKNAEKAIYDILNKQHPEECRKTMMFLKEYGENFFSEKYKENAYNRRRA